MRIINLFLAGITFFSSLVVLANSEKNNPLHLEWLDHTISPTQDFYQYADGNWPKYNPIPDTYGRWTSFQKLDLQNLHIMRNILENAAKQVHAKPGSIAQKIGDFYFSGMDEKNINKLGISPLKPEFELIDNIKNQQDLQRVITHLQLIGVNALFNFSQQQDFNDSTKVIGVAYQGGLGLPDRDYYLKSDKKYIAVREFYVMHLARYFQLLGDDQAVAAKNAKTVMQVETNLAQASMSVIEQRDLHAVYHVMNLEQLAKLTPNFNWASYLSNLGYPAIKSFNLAMPKFFKNLNDQLVKLPLTDWKTYLRLRLTSAAAPYLSEEFVKERFSLVKQLSGAKSLPERWQRVTETSDDILGFAIGKRYVKKYFSAASKQETKKMIDTIRAALKKDLTTLAWMSPQTRQAALKKLSLMEFNIGYPDHWRDYSVLKIDRGPFILNIIRGNIFLNKRELDKIGKPVDRTEWQMTPQTVNAYYDPSMNSINIPAGILQSPFYDAHASAAINYGGIGAIIGHEMTHGFDDQGAQFDGYGNLKNWWTADDLKKFNQATQCISKQFSSYVVDGDVHVQGPLVVGEATADLGGLILSWRALHSLEHKKQSETIEKITPDQQFFISYAHIWANITRQQEALRLVTIDPHPPAKYRVNGTLANMPAFQQVYDVPKNSPMNNPERCVIW